MLDQILILILCYVLGSLPFSIILSKAITGADPRESGSGNIGFSNIMRTTNNKYLSIFVATIDISKGFFACYVGGFAGGAAAMIGQMLPLWLGFSGGKGIAVLIGCLIYTNKILIILPFICFLLSRITYPSISSLFVILTYFALLFFYNKEVLYLSPAVILSFIKHISNFIRLIKGEEKKM